MPENDSHFDQTNTALKTRGYGKDIRSVKEIATYMNVLDEEAHALETQERNKKPGFLSRVQRFLHRREATTTRPVTQEDVQREAVLKRKEAFFEADELEKHLKIISGTKDLNQLARYTNGEVTLGNMPHAEGLKIGTHVRTEIDSEKTLKQEAQKRLDQLLPRITQKLRAGIEGAKGNDDLFFLIGDFDTSFTDTRKLAGYSETKMNDRLVEKIIRDAKEQSYTINKSYAWELSRPFLEQIKERIIFFNKKADILERALNFRNPQEFIDRIGHGVQKGIRLGSGSKTRIVEYNKNGVEDAVKRYMKDATENDPTLHDLATDEDVVKRIIDSISLWI